MQITLLNAQIAKEGVKEMTPAKRRATLRFYDFAEHLVDKHSVWHPRRKGVAMAALLGDETPVIQFKDFPPNATLVLESHTHNKVTLPPDTAALAISACAHLWSLRQFFEAEDDEAARIARRWYAMVKSQISGRNKKTNRLIHSYLG